MSQIYNNIIPARTDIDIDFVNRDIALSKLKFINASRSQGANMLIHNTGIYFQNIPHDPLTNISTIDIKSAETRGYFKIDFLNVSLYEGIKNEDHLNKLLMQEPRWDLLMYREFVEELWHIGNHFELVRLKKPKSIIELAMLLSIIRPAKLHLKELPWNNIEKTVWTKPILGERGYKYKDSMFKKSHAIAYASGIVVQMNLIVEQL